MKKYLIVIEETGTGYSAYSPDLDGCVATGKTREEVEREMQEAIAFHLEGMAQSGEPIPDGRLEALPTAERTVEEEQRYQRGAKQRSVVHNYLPQAELVRPSSTVIKSLRSRSKKASSYRVFVLQNIHGSILHVAASPEV